MRLLVVEDDADMNRLINTRLSKEGFSVDSCINGRQALEYQKFAEYDAIIMDAMMPEMDGFAALSKMREAGNETPVIVLTARGSLEDKIKGLNLGADDYLVKPLAFEELIARIKTVTRRRENKHSNILRCADLEVDTSAHTVKRAGETIELIAKEYALLEYLLRNKGQVLSRDQIEMNLWNYDAIVSSNVVDVYIRMLRKKIDDGRETKLIHTVRRYGYVIKEG